MSVTERLIRLGIFVIGCALTAGLLMLWLGTGTWVSDGWDAVIGISIGAFWLVAANLVFLRRTS